MLPLKTLQERALLLKEVRSFFEERSVLEIETPLLSATSSADLHLHPFSLAGGFLQTSPEFWMKRLLAHGSGDIFQICKAFRAGDSGRLHNPEFTLLEWYRQGFTLQELQSEVQSLLQTQLHFTKVISYSYAELFEKHCGINIFTAPLEKLQSYIDRHFDVQGVFAFSSQACFDFIFSQKIQPLLGGTLASQELVFVNDFLPEQAAMARIIKNAKGNKVAARFEAYVAGVELANAYWELNDAGEQRLRLEQEKQQRSAAGLQVGPIDEALLSALGMGLPDCSGCALGLDRLFMLKLGVNDLTAVLLREPRLTSLGRCEE